MPSRAIKAIFYTRFHHEKGNRVLHQVPSGSITPSTLPAALPTPLFPFSAITQYLIPTQQFCDRLLTFCVNHNRVIGYPVCIREGKYSRNEFIFNFAMVVGESEADWACYGEVVRKLGRLLRGLEEQGGFLSREEEGIWDEEEGSEGALGIVLGPGGGSKVYALCEMLLEDLNNYSECMIPIDDSNTINLKLFPTRPPPPPIHAHQVPLLTVSLSSLNMPISSDLTLNRILPYLNGVNSVSRIARLADTDLSLTRRAIQHLVYYGCLILLDVFSFGAIYAPTADIGGFIGDMELKEECKRYVRAPSMIRVPDKRGSRDERGSFSTVASPRDDISMASPLDSTVASEATKNAEEVEEEHEIDHEALITLYTSLRQGLTLKNWVLENLDLLTGIDVRRLITFGVIKGFLYRVHKYAIATSVALPPAPPTSLQTSAAPSVANNRDSDTATIRGQHGALHHHPSHPSISLQRPSIASSVSLNPQNMSNPQHYEQPKPEDIAMDSLMSERERENGLPLLRLLDGMHCFDEICTELGVPEKAVESRVRGVGEGLGVVIHR